ncbi:MAG: hypothetical protein HC821_02170 [Lewinella sp.]|nr:hypothetical protein [Lewinella sp.]
MRIFHSWLLCSLFLCSCKPEPSAKATASKTDIPVAEQLLGTWEIVELNVTCPTCEGQDSTMVQHITESDWGPLYGAKPAQTRYLPNGKLERTYYFRDGTIADVSHGLWSVQGDTLRQIEPSVVFYYRHELLEERLKLSGTIDFDRDGAADDDYQASFRLVARTQ